RRVPRVSVGAVAAVVDRQRAVEQQTAAGCELREERRRSEAHEHVAVREALDVTLALGARVAARALVLAPHGRKVALRMYGQDQPARRALADRRAGSIVEQADPVVAEHLRVVLEVEPRAAREAEAARLSAERPADRAGPAVDVVDRGGVTGADEHLVTRE